MSRDTVDRVKSEALDQVETPEKKSAALSPLARWNASLTKEERIAAATKAGKASAAARAKAKAEKEAIARAAQTFVDAGIELAAMTDDTGTTMAYHAMSTIRDIMLHSNSDAIRLKAADLYTNITGQRAAQQVKLEGPEINATFNVSEMSTADLQRLCGRQIIDLEPSDQLEGCTQVALSDSTITD